MIHTKIYKLYIAYSIMMQTYIQAYTTYITYPYNIESVFFATDVVTTCNTLRKWSYLFAGRYHSLHEKPWGGYSKALNT